MILTRGGQGRTGSADALFAFDGKRQSWRAGTHVFAAESLPGEEAARAFPLRGAHFCVAAGTVCLGILQWSPTKPPVKHKRCHRRPQPASRATSPGQACSGVRLGSPRPASRRLPPAPPAAPKPPVRGAGAGRRQPWADPAQNWVGPPPASLPGVEGTYSLDSSGEAEGKTARGGQVRCPENLSGKKGARRRALRPRARLGGCRHVQLGSARGQRPAGSRTGPRKGRCGRSSCGLGGGHVAVRRKCRLMKCRRKATVTAAR